MRNPAQKSGQREKIYSIVHKIRASKWDENEVYQLARYLYKVLFKFSSNKKDTRNQKLHKAK